MVKRRYRYSYQTIERYDSMVSNYHFQLRCTPYNLPFQRVEQFQLQLLSGVKMCNSTDTFGNTIYYGMLRECHDLFVVSANGTVECDNYQIEDKTPRKIFLSNTHLTQTSPEISQFNREIIVEGSPKEIAATIAHKIFSVMEYSTAVTNVETTAAQSFEIRAGVCQDYSHILIAMCRERAIFARYVVGYVVGTGETHAWVEVWSDGFWYGVDPTHNKTIEEAEGYIKVSHGRDAADCSVVRGIRRGVTSHTSQIRVMVEEI
ncbi:MAG: transglutaminase family protein [Rikenellaceae bacterium]